MQLGWGEWVAGLEYFGFQYCPGLVADGGSGGAREHLACDVGVIALDRYGHDLAGDGVCAVVAGGKFSDGMHKVRSILDSVGKAWDEIASHYDDEQVAFLLDFLERSNELSRQELVQLQGAPADEEEISSAPLEDQESGRLVVSCGISRLIVRADEGVARLYQARFEGPLPDVKAKEGVVTIRYPRRLLGLSGKQGAAEVALSVAIPWRIVIQGGAAEAVAS